MSASRNESELNLERDVSRAIDLLERLQRTEYNAWIGKDVDVSKLRDLQSIFESEFFTSVRRVYEQVYQSVDMGNSPDIRANATAKATVAILTSSAQSLAQSEGETRVVRLPKTEEGLGFNIMGGKEQNSPIYVSRIIPGGVADRSRDLRRGDQLVSVNGTPVTGETHEKAVSLLKAAEDQVVLVVRFSPHVLQDMESKYEKPKRRAPQPIPGAK